MAGLFITFEGTEGSGKSTQILRLAEWLRGNKHVVQTLREPGGTDLGEEIRHTLKHSKAGEKMCPETELLLMNASRAQLVREIIRPALQRNEIVLCDRFFDSTLAYQGYGRGLSLAETRAVVEFTVGPTRPDLTFLLEVPLNVSEERRRARGANASLPDRFEAADRTFFERVEEGFRSLAVAEPHRYERVNATRSIDEVSNAICSRVEVLLRERPVFRV